jgi:hypothetical protein
VNITQDVRAGRNAYVVGQGDIHMTGITDRAGNGLITEHGDY